MIIIGIIKGMQYSCSSLQKYGQWNQNKNEKNNNQEVFIKIVTTAHIFSSSPETLIDIFRNIYKNNTDLVQSLNEKEMILLSILIDKIVFIRNIFSSNLCILTTKRKLQEMRNKVFQADSNYYKIEKDNLYFLSKRNQIKSDYKTLQETQDKLKSLEIEEKLFKEMQNIKTQNFEKIDPVENFYTQLRNIYLLFISEDIEIENNDNKLTCKLFFESSPSYQADIQFKNYINIEVEEKNKEISTSLNIQFSDYIFYMYRKYEIELQNSKTNRLREIQDIQFFQNIRKTFKIKTNNNPNSIVNKIIENNRKMFNGILLEILCECKKNNDIIDIEKSNIIFKQKVKKNSFLDMVFKNITKEKTKEIKENKQEQILPKYDIFTLPKNQNNNIFNKFIIQASKVLEILFKHNILIKNYISQENFDNLNLELPPIKILEDAKLKYLDPANKDQIKKIKIDYTTNNQYLIQIGIISCFMPNGSRLLNNIIITSDSIEIRINDCTIDQNNKLNFKIQNFENDNNIKNQNEETDIQNQDLDKNIDTTNDSSNNTNDIDIDIINNLNQVLCKQTQDMIDDLKLQQFSDIKFEQSNSFFYNDQSVIVTAKIDK